MKMGCVFRNYCSQGLKVGLSIQINKVMSIKGQGHYLTLAKGHSEVKIKTCLFSETVESFGTKLHMKTYG